ncbi:MAG: sigma-70 family RNA polymerase sigma factor, partial [Verrucomicrobiales bacterium]|nr:sigma-70 family RNA polymerase sigma factor [Verrucomicrobiales bacterium]
MDDLQCLRAYARNDDQDAFRVVVERHSGLVYSAALRQVHDHAMAQDVTQAVFLALARKADRLSDRTVVAAWLLRAVRFAALHARRSLARHPRGEPLTEPVVAQLASESSTPSASAPEIVESKLDEALAALRRRDREALVLRFLEDRTLPEVALALEISEEAAKKRLQRALGRMRQALARRRV